MFPIPHPVGFHFSLFRSDSLLLLIVSSIDSQHWRIRVLCKTSYLIQILLRYDHSWTMTFAVRSNL
jgi:hypothetical protein